MSLLSYQLSYVFLLVSPFLYISISLARLLVLGDIYCSWLSIMCGGIPSSLLIECIGCLFSLMLLSFLLCCYVTLNCGIVFVNLSLF